jgi:lysophospholipase L1-like esterase
MITIALVGDSDISRWPSELFPAPSSGTVHFIVSGHSGATLQEVIPHVKETLANALLVSEEDESNKSKSSEEAATTCSTTSIHSHKDRRRLMKTQKHHVPPKSNNVGSADNDDDTERRRRSRSHDDDGDSLFLVICAGENDIGNGVSLTESTQSLDEMLSSILYHFDDKNDDDNNNNYYYYENVQMVGVIFLGPKLEPWLKHDVSARKDYIRMSRSFVARFQRRCDDLANQHCSTKKRRLKFSLAYVDCLTMFCGDNANKLPGALMGGQAQALDIYFDRDQLHLGNEGYKIWKQVVENRIRDMMSSSIIKPV